MNNNYQLAILKIYLWLVILIILIRKNNFSREINNNKNYNNNSNKIFKLFFIQTIPMLFYR